MGIFDRLLGREKPADPAADAAPRPENPPAHPPLTAAFPAPSLPASAPRLAISAPPVDLATLLASVGDLLPEVAGEAVDARLCRARLADALRDSGVEPIDPARFDALAADLDGEAWTRLDLLALAAQRDALGDTLAVVAGAWGAETTVQQGFIAVARQSPMLTLELLFQSPLRLEELSRRWIMNLGAPVAGESAEASRLALERLDYTRLLAEVERAKLSAEDRMAYLKKLQEAHEATLPRRGKW